MNLALKWPANGFKKKKTRQPWVWFLFCFEVSWYTSDLWWLSANGHLFVFVSTDLQSTEQAWIAHSGPEQSTSLHCTGDVGPTPEEPASRGVLNLFFLTIVYSVRVFYVLLLLLTVVCEVKTWTNNTYTKECSVVNCRLPSHPQWQALRGGDGITNGVTLGHCPVQSLAESASSMLCRLAESMGESRHWCECFFFPSRNGLRALKVLEALRVWCTFADHPVKTMWCLQKYFYMRWHFLFPHHLFISVMATFKTCLEIRLHHLKTNVTL